jgi:hypothetical protein
MILATSLQAYPLLYVTQQELRRFVVRLWLWSKYRSGQVRVYIFEMENGSVLEAGQGRHFIPLVTARHQL